MNLHMRIMLQDVKDLRGEDVGKTYASHLKLLLYIMLLAFEVFSKKDRRTF